MLIFTRFRKIAKLRHVCPSVSVRCMEKLDSQWRDFQDMTSKNTQTSVWVFLEVLSWKFKSH